MHIMGFTCVILQVMNPFKDKILKNLGCRLALATEVRKFNKHMDTIGIINLEAQEWLEAIPFEKLALSHDGGRRYEVITTNMSEVFNSVLKGAQSLPVTALVQLTFLGSIATLLQKGNKVITDWHQMSSILHMLMLRLRHM